jgi:Sec-independent protein translocase protein (TatC)
VRYDEQQGESEDGGAEDGEAGGVHEEAEDCGDAGSAGCGGYLRVKVALIVGVSLASPIWLYQIWAFVAPA